MGHNCDDVRSAAELLLDTPSSAHALQLSCTATESCFLFKLSPPVPFSGGVANFDCDFGASWHSMAWHAVAYLRLAVPRTGRTRHLGPGRWVGACSTHAYGVMKDGMQLHHHVFFPTAFGGMALRYILCRASML